MNTTGLINVDVTLQGVLEFSTDIAYWRAKSFPVVYQNHTTAWLFGGENVTMKADGGSIDGNGQVWMDFNQSNGNMPGRPIVITIANSKNVHIDGLSILMPMFWNVFFWYSKNVTLVNYYAYAKSSSKWSATNTDGINTWNSDHIRVENSYIRTDDDCIAIKGNSTNIFIKNATCQNGAGCAIGSIGQYADQPDYVQNVTFDGVSCTDMSGCAYVKTWQGIYLNSTSNGDGGGGGTGLVKNVTFKNFKVKNVAMPIQVSQCIYAGEDGHGCNTSKLAIEDVHWENFSGVTRYNIGASIYCSALHPCPHMTFKNVELEGLNATLGLPYSGTDRQYQVYQCGNILGMGKKCSGISCNAEAPPYFSQTQRKNL